MATDRKSVLITGCSDGSIGNALARAFHASGLRVFATARSLDKMRNLKDDFNIECIRLDVLDVANVSSCYAEVEKRLDGKGLDYLVNNAGAASFCPALEQPLSTVKKLMDTSYTAAVLLTHTFMPLLMRAKGTIVNHGSIADLVPVPWNAAHCAAKAALFAYSRTLRLELAPFGVDVIYLRTAAVLSNKLDDKPSLGPDSLYASISKEFDQRMDEIEGSGCTPEQAAKDMVHGVLKKRRWIVRTGHLAWIVWFLSWLENLLLFDIWGPMMSKQYKLDKVKR